MAAESKLQDYIEKAGSVLASIGRAVLDGGQVKAAFFQGFDELGAALKAFPDSIQVDEPGTAFNPLFRDRDGVTPAHAAAGGSEPAAMPSPSQIAAGQAPGSIHGDTQPVSRQNLPSPSEIASDPKPYLPPKEQGNVHGQERGRDL
jgi:hypothetical protein